MALLGLHQVIARQLGAGARSMARGRGEADLSYLAAAGALMGWPAACWAQRSYSLSVTPLDDKTRTILSICPLH